MQTPDAAAGILCEAFTMPGAGSIVVDTEDGRNPYDLVWRYGPDTSRMKEVVAEEWDDLYESYVAACDWSLVFDPEYYSKAFPMLAKLYHDDEDLLLEHFQTQGVHEGRQASSRFNVSSYMENCDPELVDAFGDDWECYYSQRLRPAKISGEPGQAAEAGLQRAPENQQGKSDQDGQAVSY